MSSEIPQPEPNPAANNRLHPEFFDRDMVVEPFIDQGAYDEAIEPGKRHRLLKTLAAVAVVAASTSIIFEVKEGRSAPDEAAAGVTTITAAPTTVDTAPPIGTSDATLKATKPVMKAKKPTVEQAKPFINSDPLFSSTPEWLQNYSTMPDGPINSSIWNVQIGNGVDGWGNNEAEYYTDNPANLRIENGALIIEARHQKDHGYNYTSARIDTEGKESFKYGELSIVAEVPGDSPGDWFAAWMLAENNEYENLSPLSDPLRWKNDGEIDIMEGIGSAPTADYSVTHALDKNGRGEAIIADDASTYNTYSMKWTPSSITFLVDGKAIYRDVRQPGETYKQYPFNQPYYLVLDLAMGGTWGSGDAADKAKYGPNGIDNAALPAKLKIQSIAYYPYVGASK